jgi:SAM-dependent methyltransferase
VRETGDAGRLLLPGDYFRRLREVEDRHWWYAGMRAITVSLLGRRLQRRGLSLLDGGCGTGGFLAWAARSGAFARLVGVDVSPEAIELARGVASEAELHVALLHALPLPSDSFDLVVLNDVLQHVEQGRVGPSLLEARRVLRSDGTLLVRTNAGRRFRRERPDWCLYDRGTLLSLLSEAGFRVERLTHANMVPSLWATARGGSPGAPTALGCGVPGPAGAVADAVGRRLLDLEARYLRSPRRTLPYGHTLFAVASPAPGR